MYPLCAESQVIYIIYKWIILCPIHKDRRTLLEGAGWK